LSSEVGARFDQPSWKTAWKCWLHCSLLEFSMHLLLYYVAVAAWVKHRCTELP